MTFSLNPFDALNFNCNKFYTSCYLNKSSVILQRALIPMKLNLGTFVGQRSGFYLLFCVHFDPPLYR
jgi:hypothetical protein